MIPFRNPYIDPNEIKIIKEPIPFGNPFKLISRKIENNDM